MSSKKKNKPVNIVYSTNSAFNYEFAQAEITETLPNNKQNLRVLLDKKQRNGKIVTLISGFIGTTEDLKLLEKELKNRCGVGGTSKDGEILIQGDHREKIIKILTGLGYKAK